MSFAFIERRLVFVLCVPTKSFEFSNDGFSRQFEAVKTRNTNKSLILVTLLSKIKSYFQQANPFPLTEIMRKRFVDAKTTWCHEMGLWSELCMQRVVRLNRKPKEF